MCSSGTAGSPRRSSVTSLFELMMACSPPFTATYMASVLRQDAARQAYDGLAAGQEDVDPERELRGVESPVVPEPHGKPQRSDDRGGAAARAAHRHCRARPTARHLHSIGGWARIGAGPGTDV